MVNQSQAAIVAIVIVIPMVGIFLWNSSNGKESGEKADEDTVKKEDGEVMATKKKPSVVASSYPVYLFAKQVGQDRINLDSVLPKGSDPHEWEPTPRDVQKISNSDVLIINGAGLETWVEDVSKLDDSGLKIVDASKGIELLPASSTEQLHDKSELQNNDENIPSGENPNQQKNNDGIEQHEYDPHIWLDPTRAKIQIRNIEEKLSEIDPSNSKFYKNNANSFIDKLELLDEKINMELSGCEKKTFITFHGAFSYFASQYGLTQLAVIQGGSHEEGSSPQRIQNIILQAKKLGTNTIFAENNIDPRLAEVVAEELDNGKVLKLDTMATRGISTSALSYNSGDGNGGGEGGDLYIAKMEKNVKNLRKGLCN